MIWTKRNLFLILIEKERKKSLKNKMRVLMSLNKFKKGLRTFLKINRCSRHSKKLMLSCNSWRMKMKIFQTSRFSQEKGQPFPRYFKKINNYLKSMKMFLKMIKFQRKNRNKNQQRKETGFTPWISSLRSTSKSWMKDQIELL